MDAIDRWNARYGDGERGPAAPAPLLVEACSTDTLVCATQARVPVPQNSMKISLTRSGGFAGITLWREIDTATLPADERRPIELLASRARVERASPNAEPDSFDFEITIDGARYVVDGSTPAWHALIERITTR